MTAFLIVIYSIIGIYLIFNLKHDIHMLQQNSYRLGRYWRYLQNGDMGSSWRLIDVAILFIICARWSVVGVTPFLFLVALMAICKIAFSAKKKYKKPLVFTKRVWRIYIVSASVIIGLGLWDIFVIGFSEKDWLYYPAPIIAVAILLLMSIFSWIIVIIALIVLMPIEHFINNKYIKEAKKIIKEIRGLRVIGITGSYGKTSTKYFLERILSEKFNVTMTPGSYNTLMGVIRTIREYLKPYTEIFICEMGAKQKGDIKEICDVVHPEIGIVTAVGQMHLETFKTVENIQATKFELIDSLPKDGLAVVNDDFELCAKRGVDNVSCIRYSVSEKNEYINAIYKIGDIRYSSKGSSFTVIKNNQPILYLSTKLLGEANISNVLAAIIVAQHLGMTDDEIRRGVAALEPVEHRMSMRTTPLGITIIDDAFNSNPIGSRMALDVLAGFKEQGRRIVVTPGMIELGSKQYELNKELGKKIAETVDLAIIVGNYNRESIEEGIIEGGFDSNKLYCVATFDEAQGILRDLMARGDTVLYENDLPDSFK